MTAQLRPRNIFWRGIPEKPGPELFLVNHRIILISYCNYNMVAQT